MTIFRRIAAPSGGPAGSAGDSAEAPPYRLAARFGATDAMVLRELASQVVGLVGGSEPGGPSGDAGPSGDPGSVGNLEAALGLSGDVDPPDDPALARLLPDAYRDDPEAASEFRRYTEKDLRAGKVAAAKTVLDTLPEHGGRVILSAEQGETWLRALNDMRLALGVRLDITEDITEDIGEETARLNPRDPRYGVFVVYDWLTGMQDSLVHAMS